MSLYLPGHSVLQVIFCTDMPSQKAPPLRGAGFVQVRERFCTPRPQRTLQGDQSVHDDQPPFTVCAKGWGEKDDNRLYVWTLACIQEMTIYFQSQKESARDWISWVHSKATIYVLSGKNNRVVFKGMINDVFPSVYLRLFPWFVVWNNVGWLTNQLILS